MYQRRKENEHTKWNKIKWKEKQNKINWKIK